MGSENSSAGGGVWAQAWAQVGGPTWGPSGWVHVGPTHEKIGGKFLKIFFTHEKIGSKFLKIFVTHEKIGGRFLKIFFTHEKNGGRFGTQKIQKSKILKIKIRSAQNVGKVWISQKKIILALFGAIWAHFFHGPEKSKK